MKRILLLYILIAPIAAGIAQEYVDLVIDYDTTVLVSSFLTGVTHTQYSIDPWDNATANARAKILLEDVSHFQNQHIMGWGGGNPWPDSTVTDPAGWNWGSLDTRIQLIRETNGVAVITLCGCPTWMHTPSKNGTTDWGLLETAPTIDHFDDFAHLSAEVARRYPDVEYFQVWNELKGFWNSELNRWRYEDYTRLYNMIYDSLKAVNPDIKLGGPYPVVGTQSTKTSFTSTLGGEYGYFDQRPMDVIKYWLQHKKGGDFIAIDGKTKNKDDVWKCDAFKSADKFADIISWIRKQPGGGADLDIWWSEWYAYSRPEDPQGNKDFHNALMASSLIKTIKAGSTSVLIWAPEGDQDGFSLPLGIWTSTGNSSGGQPTPFYYTYKYLKDYFSQGTKFVHTQFNSEDINVLASGDKILLVNHLDGVVNIRINDTLIDPLGPYEVRLIDSLVMADSIPTMEAYSVEFMIRDAESGDAVSACRLDFDGRQLLTDELGKVYLDSVNYGAYSLSATADGYQPEVFTGINILSDTSLTFSLNRDYPEISLRVTDRASGDPVYRAKVSYNGKFSLTNQSGETGPEQVPEGYLVYSVEHDDYFSLTDSVMVSGDTSLHIELTGTWASLRFLVSDSGGPLQNIQVTMDGKTSLTDISGLSYFSPKPARAAYPFSISQPGYKPVQDTFFLEIDTIVSVMLEPVTGTETFTNGSTRVYPNPASGIVYIELPASQAVIRLVSIDGKLLLVKNIHSGSNSLDVSGLPEGYCYLHLQTVESSSYFKLLIRR